MNVLIDGVEYLPLKDMQALEDAVAHRLRFSGTAKPLAPPTMSFPDLLHDARKRSGLTMRAVEDVTGISTPMIRLYEAGRNMPSFGNAVKLANAYGIPLDAMAASLEYQPQD